MSWCDQDRIIGDNSISENLCTLITFSMYYNGCYTQQLHVLRQLIIHVLHGVVDRTRLFWY